MDTPQQPYTPIQPSGMEPSKKSKTNKLPLIAMAVISAILLILLLIFASRAFTNDKKINDARQAGEASGASVQKTKDDQAVAQLAVSSTRTYTAPDFAGNFSIQLPTSWSLMVTPDSSVGTIDGFSAPDYVDSKIVNYPLLFSLKNQNIDSTKTEYDSLYSEKKVSREDTTVSGIKGYRYSGELSDKITKGTVVIVPIREKTFIIETDDNTKYLSAFNTILGTVKLNP